MADVTTLGLVCGTSVLINTVAAVNKKHDPVPPLVAGGTAFVGLALFGGLTNRYDIASAFAWVFLISALIFRGLPLLQVSAELASNAASSAKPVGARKGGGGSFGPPPANITHTGGGGTMNSTRAL